MHRLAASIAVAAVAAGPAAAQGDDAALSALGARERMLAVFDRLPEARLKAVFLRCARESSRRMLPLDEGALCAMAWDELLERGFGGNVDQLLAWWRANRNAPAPR